MHRRSGLTVDTDQPTVVLDAVAVLGIRFGPWRTRAPVRVVDVITEPMTVGFAYGTLAGHPESGEERLLLRLDPDASVHASIRAFSRPDRWFTRLAKPIAERVQDSMKNRYLGRAPGRPGARSR